MRTLFLALFFPLMVLASPQGIPSHTNVTVGASSTQILAANPYRGYLLVQNNGAGDCQLKFGSTITGSTDGVVLRTQQNYEPVVSYIKSSVYVKCVSGGGIAAVEANY